MEDYQYTIVLQSMMGPRAGELRLRIRGKAVSGTFGLLGHENSVSGLVLGPEKLLLSGSLHTNVGDEGYGGIVAMENGRLTGGLVTRHGCWEITGFQRQKAGKQHSAQEYRK